jgi:hypothetical protein
MLIYNFKPSINGVLEGLQFDMPNSTSRLVLNDFQFKEIFLEALVQTQALGILSLNLSLTSQTNFSILF